jgi:hypothetical protein
MEPSGTWFVRAAGNFTTNYNPSSPTNLVPRDYLTMAGLVSVNFRIYRTFGLGRKIGNAATPGGGGGRGPGGGGGGRGGAMSMGSGGGRGGFGGGTTDHRFNLTLGLNITNVLNHFNPGGYQGVITSPQFLDPTSVNTGFGGGGVATAVEAARPTIAASSSIRDLRSSPAWRRLQPAGSRLSRNLVGCY